MADDLITLVTTDHRELKRLFDMMQEDRSSRPLALPLAVAMLDAHSEAEEDRVYPAVAKEAGEKAEAEHAAEEHHQAEDLGRHLLEMDWESQEFDQALQEWISAVLHHVEEEENEILPALREAVDEDRLRELGLQFAARRSRALAGQPLAAVDGGTDTGPRTARRPQGGEGGARTAGSTARSGGAPKGGTAKGSTAKAGGTGTRTESQAGGTRAELYDKARELGIEGRSSMTKEELAREVSKAQGGGKGRRKR
ncbi:hemerythrin domain-containing protein [Streptomyces sp. NPDC052682]|uniref:hemerythrin domain-containing protein n=1 Tax=Streptomyces sp. NPDC052682 TaxID=3154954 RepID=UPI003428F357